MQVGGGGQDVAAISAIVGTAGVGKTALAVYWAHKVARDFPDGQLYVNLRGFDPVGPPVSSAQAIRGFLEALGVPAERIPADYQAQVGLYRTLLAGKRMLIVLDNARDPAQVRPLLAAGSGCMVIVTSRNQLLGLAAAENAQLLTLDVLTGAEARELLARRLGHDRTEADPPAVEELATLCARLPLALSIAAARAAARANIPLAALVSELQDTRGRLDALQTGEPDGDMRAVFSWSFQNLADSGARMFRLLGLHPGPDITIVAAASLAGIPPAEARRQLAELVAAHLIEEHALGRFAFHDLLRAYAAEQASRQDSDEQCQAATQRMLDYYLHTAHAADSLLQPQRDPITLAAPLPGTAESEHLAGPAQALTWFEAECGVLLTAVVKAAERGFDTHAWQLTWTMAGFLSGRAHWEDWAAVQQVALTSAQCLGDTTAQALMLRYLGQAYSQLESRDAAYAHMRQALSRYEEAGDRIGQARLHLDIGHVLEKQGRYREDLAHSQRALELFRAASHRGGQARALNAVGWSHLRLGDYHQPITYCTQALDLYSEGGDTLGAGCTWDSLGLAYFHLRRYADAIPCYQRAIEMLRNNGELYNQATAQAHLGDTHRAVGDHEAAQAAWKAALDILDEMSHPEAKELRGKLQGLARTE
jgi:tetratricopeptide (TPR) repeat protein